jgi:hypothetical protein
MPPKQEKNQIIKILPVNFGPQASFKGVGYFLVVDASSGAIPRRAIDMSPLFNLHPFADLSR